MLLDRRDEWLAARLEDLDYGDVDGIKAVIGQRLNWRRQGRYGLSVSESQSMTVAQSAGSSVRPRFRPHSW